MKRGSLWGLVVLFTALVGALSPASHADDHFCEPVFCTVDLSLEPGNILEGVAVIDCLHDDQLIGPGEVIGGVEGSQFDTIQILANGVLTINNTPCGLWTNANHYTGELIVDSGAVTIINDGRAFLGTLTTISGGSLSFESPFIATSDGGLELVSGRSIEGFGVINGEFHGFQGSSVIATGPLTIGLPTGFFDHSGAFDVGANTVTLKYPSRADFGGGDELTLSGGLLRADNGIFIGAARTLRGFGTIEAGTSGSQRCVNTGTIVPETSFGLVFDTILENRGATIAGTRVELTGTGGIIGRGTINAEVFGSLGSTIDASGSGNVTLVLGILGNPDGFETLGSLNVGRHTIVLRDLDHAILGNLTTVGSGATGGTLQAINGILLDDPGDTLSGNGVVDAPVLALNSTAISVDADGSLELGDGSTAGFEMLHGSILVDHSRLTLNDADEALLGLATTLVSSVLEACNGMRIDGSDTIFGHGIIIGTLSGTNFPGGMDIASNPSGSVDINFDLDLCADAAVFSQGVTDINSQVILNGFDLDAPNGIRINALGTLTIDGGVVTTRDFSLVGGGDLEFDAGELVMNGGTFSGPSVFGLGGINPLDKPTLRLRSGSFAQFTDFFIGNFPGASAAVELNASTLNASDDLVVAGTEISAQADGSLDVLAGGTVHVSDELIVREGGTMSVTDSNIFGGELRIRGDMTMSGATSTLQVDDAGGFGPINGIHIGLSAPQTTVTIERGGTLNAPGIAFNVGSDTGSPAQVNLVDPDSTLTVATAVIAAGGDGTLVVQNEARAIFTSDLTLANTPSVFGTLLVDGPSSSMTCNGRMTVARRGAAILQVSAGASVHTLGDTEVGSIDASGGFVLVTSGGANWTSDGSIYVGGDDVGQHGSGELNVRSGAIVDNAGTLRIWPTGKLTMEGGLLRTRDLLAEGAILELRGGTIQIDGGQYRHATSLVFGGVDPGNPVILEFLNGADAQITFAWHVGGPAGTHGATTVSGVSAGGQRSTLFGTGGGGGADLVVAREGNGSMQVLDGALADFGDDIIIAAQDNAVGRLDVGGMAEGFRATVRAMRGSNTAIMVGGKEGATGGNGRLNVFDGGLVETAGDMTIARNAQARGDVTLFGRNGLVGEIRVGDDVFLGGSASAPGGPGEILLSGGGLLVVNDVLKVWPDGFVDMDEGTLRVNHLDLSDAEPGSFNFFLGRIDVNQITGDLENFSGTLAHGAIVGDMIFDGDYTQFSTATLEIEIIDLNRAVQDVLNISGAATLAGTLHVIVDPAFTLLPGETLTILTSSSRVGEFAELIVDGPGAFEIVYTGNDVSLIVDVCPGSDDTLDADGDGVPDGCDICPGFDDSVDADGDGVPDGCDTCSGFDDNADADGDAVPDGCDACLGSDDTLDADGDGVADGCDQCPNFDDGNLPAPGTQPTLLVAATALGANDGTSWDDAFTDLQTALCAATMSGGVVTEIWVAAGTYTPTGFAGDRERTFQLLNGVSLFGGFAGGETLLSRRDPQANATILSGDLNADDAPISDPDDLSGEPTRADNSHHVVTGSGTDATAILDGFTITAGGDSSVDGGGLFNSDGSPTIVGCRFFQNQAASGGGMYNENSNPTVTDCTFNANSAPLCGGGMFNIDGSSPTVVNCAFGGNMSGSGGGMSNDDSSPTVVNCAFSGNMAFGGGGMYNNSSSPTVINSTFSGNAVTFTGGGIYACGENLTITNCIFWENVEDVDGNAGGPFNNESAQIDVACGPATVNHSDVQGGWTGAGANNLNTDPLFVDADGADNIVGTDDDDLRLQTGSPCIDVGDDGAVTEPADLDGNTRVVGCAVDMGAYEQQTILDTDGDGVPDGCDVCIGFDDTVDSDSDGVPDGCDVCLGDDATGDSDADGICDDIDACPGSDDTVDSDNDGVPDGCDFCLGDDATGDSDGDGVCDDIDACAGFDDTLDADGDDVPDGCDVCPGHDDTLDTDGDGVPEGCDVCPGFDDTTDSDSDGVPDGCDVCPGFDDNLDANANGVPDDCELPCDIDLDGDVDGTDNAIFVSCMTGPVNTTPLDALCAIADLDLDDDIDMLDYAECHTAFTGPSASDLPNTTVTGLVRMPDGGPVIGAAVELAGGGPSVVSKSDGRFLIPSVPVALGEISVIASVSIEGEDFFGSARVAELVGGGMTDVGIITLHNVVNWVSPADGLWSDGVNWDTGLPPGADLSVVIDVPDPEITVTHDAGAPNDGPLANLLCNERLRIESDTLSVAGVFQMNNTLEMEFGELVDSTVDLGPGAVINMLRGSTLDGVTINGNMDILGTNNILEVLNGLTINGDVRIAGVGFQPATGSGLGLHGPNKILDGNATYTFISNPSTSFIAQSDAGSLHIKPGVTIRGAEGRVGHSDHPLVQDGVIDSDSTGTIEIKGLDWVNNGALRSRGDGSVLRVGDAWTNHGSIEATNSGQLVLGDPGHSFQNLGTITATGADVRLNGDFVIADLGTFDFINSLVAIEGTLLNDAGLVLDADRFNWKLGGGTILGGTISSADGTTFGLAERLCCSSIATFDGVTLDADMQMSTNDFLFIENGLTLNGVITMPGFITGTVNLHFKGPNRFIDGTGRIEFSRAGQNNVVQSGTGGPGDLGVLTIGPGITIGGAGGVIGVSGNVFPASLVNEGTIHSDRSGGIVVSGTGSINNGILKSSDGSLQITGPWTNNGTVHVGGGSLVADKTWTNNGIARLGVGPVLESRADYTQTSAGTFISEILSTADDGYGRMTVTETATLDGVLRIEFENTFTPMVGQSFAVLEYGDHIGEFATIETVGLDPGFQIVPTYHESFLGLVIQPK